MMINGLMLIINSYVDVTSCLLNEHTVEHIEKIMSHTKFFIMSTEFDKNISD